MALLACFRPALPAPVASDVTRTSFGAACDEQEDLDGDRRPCSEPDRSPRKERRERVKSIREIRNGVNAGRYLG